MKKLFLFFCVAFLVADAFAQKTFGYTNPVLPGFHSDPSVCRNGDDYYLVNSTFQFFPGVPVYHSKDLIHWEQIGACLTRDSQIDLSGCDEQAGIYATTIRCNNGRFYMVTTHFPSRRHFYVYTDDPAGEWSDPITIPFDIGSCDPTLYFEDEKCYFLWKNGDIKICEIDVETGKQLGEIHHLGAGLGGRYPEGPHIYKKDGYYYMMLAEGGTEHGHHVNILRSRNLFGPYEANKANPILSHFNMEMQNSNIQGLGHADLVQAPDSSWWMICLGYRTHGYLQHVMGRETFLAPVRWDKNAWPVVNGNGTLDIDMQCETLPQVPMPLEPKKDDFDKPKLNLFWSHLCNPIRENYSLSARKGWLRMKTSPITIDEKGKSPTFIGRRQTQPSFVATTKVDVANLKDGGEAGIVVYAAALNHYDTRVVRRNGKLFVQAVVRLGQTNHIEKEIEIKGSQVYLRAEADPQFYYLAYSTDGKNFSRLAKMEYRFLSTETIGGFVGVHIGLFAQGNSDNCGSADFDYFEYDACGGHRK